MFEFQMADIMPALPEIFLAGISLVLVLVAAYGGETPRNARRTTPLSLTAQWERVDVIARRFRDYNDGRAPRQIVGMADVPPAPRPV